MVKNFLYIILAIAFIVSCSDKGTDTETDDLAPRLKSSWEKYDQSPPDYLGAKEAFTSIISDYSSRAQEALYGRGWCYAHLANGPSDMQYTQAVTDFNNALQLSDNLPHAYSGLAYVNLAINKYSEAIDAANSVLDLETDYSFEHEPELSTADIRLLLAQAYFYTGDYQKVKEQLDVIAPDDNHPYDQPDVLLLQIQELRGTV